LAGTALIIVKLHKMIYMVLGSKMMYRYTLASKYTIIYPPGCAGVEHISTAALALYVQACHGATREGKSKVGMGQRQSQSACQGGAASYERMVLQKLTSRSHRSDCVHSCCRWGWRYRHGSSSPLHLLGTALVKERVKKHLGSLFIGSIGHRGQ